MLDQILVIVSVTFLVMVSPGPDMVLVLRNTLVSGRPAGLQTSMGILSGNLIHITYCVLGIGLLISQSIIAFSALRYAGAAYLIYLGIVSVRSGAKTLATTISRIGGPTEHGSFRGSSTICSTRKARFSISACLRWSLLPGIASPRPKWLPHGPSGVNAASHG
jgi:threonine/homoserine/homoserine lactone efflux protein